MTDNASLVAIGIVGFAATNIDDIFLLMMFFSYSSMTFPVKQVVIGQYLGIGLLVAISALGFLFSLAVSTYMIRLLGLVPILIGIKKIIEFRKKNQSNSNDTIQDKKRNSLAFVTVASVTFSNGGDNIGIYTPLFAKYNSLLEISLLVVIFMAMTGLWCLTAYYFLNHSMFASKIRRVGHMILPFILIALGVYILTESFIF